MQHTRVDEAHLLAAGDVVRTDPSDPSVAEVVHHSGAVTRLDPGSEAVVDRAELDGRPRIIVTLGPGRTWHHTGPFEDPTIYEARGATAVATARFATFSVTCRRDGSVDVAAVRGNVVVRGINAGSVALSDGQTVRVEADGRAGTVEPAPDLDADPWVELNLALDDAPADVPEPAPAPAPEADRVEAQADADEQIEPPAPLPRWAGRTLAVGAAAGFIALLAVTFTSAQKGDDAAARIASDGEAPAVVAVRPVTSPVAALPAGAAAMVRAAQDRSVAPETVLPPPIAPTKVRVRAPEPIAPEPAEPPAPTTTTAPAPVATATATGSNCARRNGVVVYSGTLTNTSPMASGFVVDAVFLTASGSRAASGHATVSNVAPGRRASWSITVSGSSVRSCEVAGVRAV
jgi:hypothetical protein